MWKAVENSLNFSVYKLTITLKMWNVENSPFLFLELWKTRTYNCHYLRK